MSNDVASPKFRRRQNYIGFFSGASRIRQRGCPSRRCDGEAPSRRRLRGSGGKAPSSHGFLGFLQEKYSFSRIFLSKSGLNPPLLALLVDLRYSISIFVCTLVISENISGGQLSLLPPLLLATPLGMRLFCLTLCSATSKKLPRLQYFAVENIHKHPIFAVSKTFLKKRQVFIHMLRVFLLQETLKFR